MRKRTDEQVATEKLTIFSVAAIYSFIAAFYESGVNDAFEKILVIIWWIPPLLISYGLLRWHANDDMIQLIGQYIKWQSEAVLAKGWENYKDPDQYDEYKPSCTPTRRVPPPGLLFLAEKIRRLLLEDNKGFSRVWPIMEVLRMIILIATIVIAVVQSV